MNPHRRTPRHDPAITDLLTHLANAVFDDAVGIPQCLAAADLEQEALEYAAALTCASPRGETAGRASLRTHLPSRQRCIVGGADRMKLGGSSSTRSPWLIPSSSRPQPSALVWSSMSHAAAANGLAHAPGRSRIHACPKRPHGHRELRRHGLHPVTDAQYRHAPSNTFCGTRVSSPVTVSGPPRQDDAVRVQRIQAPSQLSYGAISRNTPASRTRRAINFWVYCEPKSTISTLWAWDVSGHVVGSKRRGARVHRASGFTAAAAHQEQRPAVARVGDSQSRR